MLAGFILTPLVHNDGHCCDRCKCWRNNANIDHSEIKAQKRNVERLRGLSISRQLFRKEVVFSIRKTLLHNISGGDNIFNMEVLELRKPPSTEFRDRTVPVMDKNVIRFGPFHWNINGCSFRFSEAARRFVSHCLYSFYVSHGPQRNIAEVKDDLCPRLHWVR